MSVENFNNNINRIYENLESGDTISASMMGEEILSDCFSQWNNDPTPENASMLIAATCAYSQVLMKMSRFQEAYSACLVAAAVTAKVDVEAPALLSLFLITWQILEGLLSNTAPKADSKAQKGVTEIASALGSLLYSYYYATGHSDPENPALPDAYKALKTLSQLVNIDTDPGNKNERIKTILKYSEEIGLIQ